MTGPLSQHGLPTLTLTIQPAAASGAWVSCFRESNDGQREIRLRPSSLRSGLQVQAIADATIGAEHRKCKCPGCLNYFRIGRSGGGLRRGAEVLLAEMPEGTRIHATEGARPMSKGSAGNITRRGDLGEVAMRPKIETIPTRPSHGNIHLAGFPDRIPLKPKRKRTK